jgi:hypothetical protein
MTTGAGILLVALAACSGGSPTVPDVPLDQPFDLRAGGSVVIASDQLRISLQEVRNDSRCAVDVQCVWEGDAEVVLRVEAPPAHHEDVVLHTSGHNGPDAKVADVLGHRFELKDLKPANKSKHPIDPKAYVATLVISRLDR